MALDVSERQRLAEAVLQRLEAAIPGSKAWLQGSLADQTEDDYSSIKVRWEVPGARFPEALTRVEATLGEAGKVLSFRSDPAFHESPTARTLFVEFESVPAFWPVELVVQCLPGDVPEPAAGLPAVEWSWPESAAWTAVAAVKAMLREREAEALQQLDQGAEQLGVGPLNGTVPERIGVLLAAVRRAGPKLERIAARVERLAIEWLPVNRDPGTAPSTTRPTL